MEWFRYETLSAVLSFIRQELVQCIALVEMHVRGDEKSRGNFSLQFGI